MRRVATALLAILLTSIPAVPVAAQGRGWYGERTDAQYERGYRDGVRDGQRDARSGRAFDYDHDRRLSRRGDPFQRGYSDGYRAGFQQFRGRNRSDRNWGRGPGDWGRGRGGYQDPAFSRGYSEGFEKGLDDGRDRDRYDPVRHRDYRDADDGYFGNYGSRQAYENNYRAGFRQGYEEGYRDGTRSRR
jgi:flagellar biosynthesis/type III secretory pathway protein FliH